MKYVFVQVMLLTMLFTFFIPIVNAFPDSISELDIMQRKVSATQKIVAQAPDFPEKRDLLIKLNNLRKTFLQPVEGMEKAKRFLEEIATLNIAEHTAAIQKKFQETQAAYWKKVLEKEEMKINLDKTLRNDPAYFKKVARLETMHEILARMQGEVNILTEAHVGDSQGALTRAKKESARLVAQSQDKLAAFEQTKEFLKIKKVVPPPHIPISSSALEKNALKILPNSQDSGEFGGIGRSFGKKKNLLPLGPDGFTDEDAFLNRALRTKLEQASASERVALDTVVAESRIAGTTPVSKIISVGGKILFVTMVAGAVVEAYDFPGNPFEKAVAGVRLFTLFDWALPGTPNILPVPYARYNNREGLSRLMVGAGALSDPVKLDEMIGNAARMIMKIEQCKAKVANENENNMNRFCTIEIKDVNGTITGLIFLDARRGLINRSGKGAKLNAQLDRELKENTAKLNAYQSLIYADLREMIEERKKMSNSHLR